MSRSSYIYRKPLPAIPTKHVDFQEIEQEGKRKTTRPWRPVTLRPLYLGALISITVGLIIIIQWLLYISRREHGLLFFKDIDSLPLSRSFSYTYLPTIVSVLYSFMWTWVDLDVKRLEPYFQLSKAGGASGGDSVLLSYPLEFLITLPFTALKRRHWSVMSASIITILVFWGLTPTQAGIFATRTVSIKEHVPGSYSTGYASLDQQGNLSAIYAQSVYNIAWLNETLPAFMTKDYVLSEFGPIDATSDDAIDATYTGPTLMYSVDLSCEDATMWNRSGSYYYNSSQGCSFAAPRYRPMGGNDTTKPFDALYVGYQNQNGFASYYLSSDCNESFYHLFFVRWSKSTASAIEEADKPGNMEPAMANETSLFCQAAYYQQNVSATVSLPTNEVLSFRPLGEKQALPPDLFNVSTFEWAMSSGVEEVQTRGDYPTSSFPDQKSQLLDTPLNLAFLPRMAPFAIASSQQPIEAYMDAEILRNSYQSAYRLLFARQLSDVLKKSGQQQQQLLGERNYAIETILVVPMYAYAATALLSLVLALLAGLMVIIPRRANKLQQDPCTISAVMTLASGDSDIADTFATFDRSSSRALQAGLQNHTFCLRDSPGVATCRLRAVQSSGSQPTMLKEKDTNFPKPDPQGIRPAEMKLAAGAAFFILQLASIVTFAVLYYQSRRNNGLPLPSQSTFVRQLLQNYIPIALATFIEPFWLVLNRLLSMLQPFEDLRRGNATAFKTIDLDYSSVPPQLLFARALRAGHFVLAILCSTVLLANVLAVALSGLMYEGTAEITTATQVLQSISPHFQAINGTGTPFNGKQDDNSQGGTTTEPFYLEMSNLTANTPLPAWVDEQYAYLPVNLGAMNKSATIQLETPAYGVDLQCETLLTEGAKNYSLRFDEDASGVSINVTLSDDDGNPVTCTNFKPWTRSYADSALNKLRDPQPGHVAVELNAMLSSRLTVPGNDLFCRQHILAGWIRADWTVVSAEEGGTTLYGLPIMRLDSVNQTMLLCRPSISIGSAEVVIDSDGRVQRTVSANLSSTSLEQYFTSDPANLIAQANQFLLDSDSTWHNDSAPSDYLNYLMKKISGDSSFLNATHPNPTTDVAAKSLASVYRRLFALLIGVNTQLLFETASNEKAIAGQVVTPQIRILLSTPAFIVVEAIMAFYIITTIFFYARRPWRVLPRLPGSLASNIAFFAAGSAFKEMFSEHGEIVKNAKESWRWGYGTFNGRDGRCHIGVEREPFVNCLKIKTASKTPGKQGLRPMLLRTSTHRNHA